MDNSEWERADTNADLQKLVEITGNVFPIVDVTCSDLALFRDNYFKI